MAECCECKRQTAEDVAGALGKEFGECFKLVGTETRRIFAEVPRGSIFKVCSYVHDELKFEHMSSVTGIDLMDNLEVTYHVNNYYNGIVLELRVSIPLDDLHVDSITPIWEGANWHERETYELFGIIFDNHPKLERLLTPETYSFFPFRKSYKLRGQQ